MPASEDEVGHYYEAQLIHDGLEPSKNKAVAKVRLLEALNKGTLKAPEEVLKLEKAMKKEYDAENKRAKAAMMKAQQGVGALDGGSKKRKAAEVEPASLTKKAKADVGSSAVKKPAANPLPKPKPAVAKEKGATAKTTPATKKQATSKAKRPVAKDDTNAAFGAVLAGLVSKVDGMSQFMMSSIAQGSQAATATKKSPAKKAAGAVESTVKKQAVKKEPLVKREPVIKRSPAVKKEAAIKHEPDEDKPVKKQTARRTPMN